MHVHGYPPNEARRVPSWSARRRGYEFCKRALDIVLALVGLVLLAPVFLVIAVLIRLDSPGPVFYRPIRTGRHRVPFRTIKFRTMYVGSDQLGVKATAKDDPRVTRLGRRLRLYKLDELPNLINVLLGEMSIVGPRPENPVYTDLYVGEEQLILTVRPGITDFASVRFVQLAEVLGAENADKVYEESVLPVKNKLRVKYVRERGMWVDLRIIFATLFGIMRSVRARKPAEPA